jgi:hypothetical protein
MTADTIPDRFAKLGVPAGDTSDVLSSTPIGTPTIPPVDQMLDYYPINPGAAGPAPPP